MKKSLIIFAIIYVAISFWTGCREEYQPAVINGNNDYLVVEGIINPDSTTIFLSRTRNLNDTVSFVPESNATVTIEGERAGSFVLQRKGNGIYAIGRISVNVNDNYRLKIIARSKLYQSDFVTVKKAPPIDSLPWKQETDVAVYLNAHDPSNNTRYYRWEYEETWQHESFYDSHLGYVNGQIVFLDSSQLVHVCWSTVGSSEILLGNSSQLSSDKIENMPIVLIRSGSEKLIIRYSILVKQYALTKEAYEFWQLLKKNTNQVGGLFDAQPSELIGNIHCISDPAEPTIGFVSASTIETKRIFISRAEITSWNPADETSFCAPKTITPDSAQFYLSDTSYAPAYFTNGALAIANKTCVDCRRKGGNVIKPGFWP